MLHSRYISALLGFSRHSWHKKIIERQKRQKDKRKRETMKIMVSFETCYMCVFYTKKKPYISDAATAIIF